MNHRPSPAGATLITPSPPIPARRSQMARTRSGSNSRVPAASGNSTKSFSVPCPFTNAMPSPTPTSLRSGQERVDGLDQVGPGCVEPPDPVVATEPRSLPSDEPPGGLHRRRHSLGGSRSTVDDLDELRIAQCARGRAALAQPSVEQGAHLRFQTGVDH